MNAAIRKAAALSTNVAAIFIMSPHLQLVCIMSLNTSHCLVQSIRSSMLMVRALEEVLVKYDERLLCRILGAVQVPIMVGVPTLNRDIPIIHQNDIEISRIDFL